MSDVIQSDRRHRWSRMDRPRECQECGFEEHDGSGIGYESCPVDWDRDTSLASEAALRERVAVLERALGDIKYEAERENGGWVHLKRVIAVKCATTLKGTTDA